MVVRLLRALLLILALLPEAWAAGNVLLLGEDNSAHAEFAASLADNLRPAGWNVERNSVGKTDLIVTVGSESFRKALAQPGNLPILATLIQRPAYEHILAESGRSRPRTSAVFLEQPAARQAAFIRQLLPGFNRIGLLSRTETRASLSAQISALNQAGLSTDSENCDRDSDLLPALNALLPRTGLLLATPDTEIYRRDNIKAILITSYRYHKPVIAFSPTFVQAGALAAIYTTPNQFALQVAEIIQTHGGNLPAPREPQGFSIAVNRNVAQALNLNIAEDSALRRAMNEREGR